MKITFLYIQIILIVSISCSNTHNKKIEERFNNTYHSNHIESISVYTYEFKFGKVDSSTISLSEKLKFNEIGNLIFFYGTSETFDEYMNQRWPINDNGNGSIMSLLIEDTSSVDISYDSGKIKHITCYDKDGNLKYKSFRSYIGNCVIDSIFDDEGLAILRKSSIDSIGREIYSKKEYYNGSAISKTEEDSCVYKKDGYMVLKFYRNGSMYGSHLFYIENKDSTLLINEFIGDKFSEKRYPTRHCIYFGRNGMKIKDERRFINGNLGSYDIYEYSEAGLLSRRTSYSAAKEPIKTYIFKYTYYK